MECREPFTLERREPQGKDTKKLEEERLYTVTLLADLEYCGDAHTPSGCRHPRAENAVHERRYADAAIGGRCLNTLHNYDYALSLSSARHHPLLTVYGLL